MRNLLERAHDTCHGYIGSNMGDTHISFRDPFVFLLHSNVDRVFAEWQHQPGCEWRLDLRYVYGSESNSTASIDDQGKVRVGIKSLIAPSSIDTAFRLLLILIYRLNQKLYRHGLLRKIGTKNSKMNL